MLSIKELVEATDGVLINGNEEDIPKNYIIDSRNSKKGDFFVPIVGEKKDAHDFIVDCVKNEIAGFFISKNNVNKENIINESKSINKKINIIEVEDTKQALIKAGMFNRQKNINIPVVAVTGSVGKTSTRQIIASVLSTEKNVLVTSKNYNSDIGISIMCLLIDNQDVCVFEAGIDHFDEMDLLSEILKPDVACMTIIGTSHIGTFKTRDNIFKEKFKITNYLKEDKKLVINFDDDKLNKIDDKKYKLYKVSQNDISNMQNNDEKITFTTKIYGKDELVTINQIGIHNAKNALFAIKVGEIFNISKDNIIKGISEYKNFNNRLNYKKVKNIKIIDDTYNSSFESIKVGIDTIEKINSTRKIIVFGDVFDLADKSEEIHKDIGKYLIDKNIDIALFSGDAMKSTYDILKKYKECKYFNNKQDIIDYLLNIVKEDDLIYFKASNGMKYTDLVNEFIEKM